MYLHIFIGGKERAKFSVEAAMVPQALRHIDERMDALQRTGKVAVTLDSVIDPNLSYVLYPRRTRGPENDESH